jgi:hypothetical protein
MHPVSWLGPFNFLFVLWYDGVCPLFDWWRVSVVWLGGLPNVSSCYTPLITNLILACLSVFWRCRRAVNAATLHCFSFLVSHSSATVHHWCTRNRCHIASSHTGGVRQCGQTSRRGYLLVVERHTSNIFRQLARRWSQFPNSLTPQLPNFPTPQFPNPRMLLRNINLFNEWNIN